ncbi:MAG: helix-turn-helix domain-containing protein [Tepidisphaeraceae bacterium]|jgi:transcriptional regulator with XRE-family HTH domain
MTAQMVKIEGKELVILSRSDFDALMERAGVMPRLPKAAKDGSVPAVEFATVDIAREVVRRRIAAGMTQQELAKRVGVRPETISRLEAGKHIPQIETMERIDRVLPSLKRPRSSVDQTESQNPSEHQQIFQHGGHVVDTDEPLSGDDRHRANFIQTDLQIVIDAWAKLPKPIRAGVIAMIKASI